MNRNGNTAPRDNITMYSMTLNDQTYQMEGFNGYHILEIIAVI